MRRLVLIRHGLSRWNVERRIQGQSGAGLAEEGALQAQHTATFVAQTWPDAQLWSSDLDRCMATAAPIAEALEAEVRVDERLRERHFGEWTGLTLSEVREGWPEHWAAWRTGRDVVAELGGESSDQLVRRVRSVLEERAGEVEGTTIAVTHGGPVWHGTHALAELEHATLGGIANASVTVLEPGGHGRWMLAAFNQTAHLPADLRTAPRPSRRGDIDPPVAGR